MIKYIYQKLNILDLILDIIIPNKLYAFCLGLLTGITSMLIDECIHNNEFSILIVIFIAINMLNYCYIIINYFKIKK